MCLTKPEKRKMGGGAYSCFLRSLKTMNVLGPWELGVGVPYQTLFAELFLFPFLPSSLSSLPSDGCGNGDIDIENPPLKSAITFLLWQMLEIHKSAHFWLLLIHSWNWITEQRKALSKAFLFKEKNSSIITISVESSFCFFGSVIVFLSWFLPVSLRQLFKMCLLHRKQQSCSLAAGHSQATHSRSGGPSGPNFQKTIKSQGDTLFPFYFSFCPQGTGLCLVLVYFNSSLALMSLYNKVRSQGFQQLIESW